MEKNLKIINRTPHNVVISNGENITFSPEGEAIRLPQKTVNLFDEQWVNFVKTQYLWENLPPKVEDTIYIVSLPVAQYWATIWRDDFVIPNDIIRDDKWVITWCKNLAFVC